jgi:polysaccharide deacetylase 2 family uncharacterized protein YibQ
MPPSRRRPTTSRHRRFIPILLLFVIGIVVAFFFASGNYRKAGKALAGRVHPQKKSSATENAAAILEDTIRSRLHRLEVPDSLVARTFFSSEKLFKIRAAIPRGEPMATVLAGLSGDISGTAYRVDDCACEPDERRCDIRFVSSIPGGPMVILTVTRAPQFLSSAAEMAIVITDIGSVSDDIGGDLLALPAPLTIALTPTPAAKARAKRIAGEANKEVLLLLPMEPVKRSHDDLHKLSLMLHYPDDKLRSLIHGSMVMVPRFAGFGNFGGSRTLEDSRVMTIVLSEMKKRHAYFLERAATRKSVAAALCESLAMPCATVQGVIDSGDEAAERAQIVHYALEARKRGKIIVAAKASDELLGALRDEIPLFEHNGIKLEPVSRLLDTTGESR